MKVYRLTADIDRKYAQIHSQMEQEPKEGITVMWDDWLVKGNIIPDFIFSVYSISKTKIIEDLQNRFNGLEKIKLLWEKNPKEEVAKNIHRLKWLPKEKDPKNKVAVEGHKGPHGEDYHKEIYNRLEAAGARGEEKARKEGITEESKIIEQGAKEFIKELQKLSKECSTEGERLNKIITKKI